MRNRVEASSTVVMDESRNLRMVPVAERVMPLGSRVVPISASFDHNLQLMKTDWWCVALP